MSLYTKCHICHREIHGGDQFLEVGHREAYPEGDDSDETDSPWHLCSKGCARKALAKIKPVKRAHK